ncbi:MAG: hypothetical protein COA79_19430 [Planctomycetota bacterium]|nr:MAG: hypothetical protein COA79_19430 [Planctomycetota bacterium]
MKVDITPHRPMCLQCFLKKSHCICQSIKKIKSPINVIILQHFKERNKSIGTEKIIRLSLTNSKTIRGIDFNQNPIIKNIQSDKDNEIYLLYPNENAQNASQVNINSDTKKYLIVIDGTWTQAKQIVKLNPWLKDLPTIQLDLPMISQYKIRTQPFAMCLSTVEAITYCLEQMEKQPEKYKTLLLTFNKMIERQCQYIPLEHLENRPKYRKLKKGKTK